jgi:hypothetical protein
MAIHLVFTVEIDPHDPEHQLWLEKFRGVMDDLPSGSTAQEKIVPRDVQIHELREFLRLQGDHPKDLNIVTRRMWSQLVRVCYGGGSHSDAEMPDDVQFMPLPLTVLKLVTRAHFQGGRAAARTRLTLLDFISSLQ